MSATTTPLVLHRTIPSIRAMRRALDPSVSIGFVPTMGALHKGHLSLLREARAKNTVVVASIFVNPTQFGPTEDLDKYPRQLERDSELLNELGVDHLFAPAADSMYGPNHVTYVDPVGFDETAEGRARPGHFRGVATIVTKLFHIVQPTRAYFGQKDAAQCVMIRRMVQDLDMDMEIVVKDTVREADGLAMSSRNAYLTTAERRAAPVVYRALCAAWDQWERLPRTAVAGGGGGGSALSSTSSIESCELQETIKSVLGSEPLVSEIQYISVDSKATMQPLTHVSRDEGAIISLACKVGSVRLIDNIVL